jgi:hypothetical protein
MLIGNIWGNTASVRTKFSTRGNVDVKIDLDRCMIVPESGSFYRRGLKPASGTASHSSPIQFGGYQLTRG